MIKPKVAIVILNWNNIQDTIECIESVQKMDYDNYQTFVLDNGSEENPLPKIKKLFPEVIAIRKDSNYGFAEGNNIATNIAIQNNPKYVLLLNNDTIVERDFLSRMINYAEEDNNYGIIGPIIKFYSTNKIQSAGFSINMTNGVCKLLTDIPKAVKEVDAVSGSAMLIRATIIKKIGLFDKRYFSYWEETDFCIRAKLAGYKCVVVPTNGILHKSGASGGGQHNKIEIYYMSRNNILLMKKHVSPIKFILFLVIYLFYRSPLRICAFIIRNRMDLIKAHLKGLMDGLEILQK